jgi:glycosyltransferase involved in cell wall biosynthesis
MPRKSALLVVNRQFIQLNGTVLTEGATGPETGERYLKWFGKVCVVGREGVLKGDPRRLNEVKAPGLKVLSVPGITGIFDTWSNWTETRGRLLDFAGDADCVIARVGGLGSLAGKIAMEMGKPLAIDLGGCPFDGLRTHGSKVALAYAPVAFFETRVLIRRARWVSYVTESFLQRRYPAQSGAVTAACSNVEIPDPGDEVLARRWGRIEGLRKTLRFGTIGSLHGRFKGIQHAIPALAKVADSLPCFEYRVLGGGDPEPWRRIAMKHGLGDRVFFDGTSPSGQAVYDWLDQVDIYLHPSLREGLPRAVVEAMSRGCPVIASDVAGTPELLVPADMHRPGDVGHLASLILQAVNPEWQMAAAERNWTRAKDYSHSVLAKKRDEFWGAFAKAVADGTA